MRPIFRIIRSYKRTCLFPKPFSEGIIGRPSHSLYALPAQWVIRFFVPSLSYHRVFLFRYFCQALLIYKFFGTFLAFQFFPCYFVKCQRFYFLTPMNHRPCKLKTTQWGFFFSTCLPLLLFHYYTLDTLIKLKSF